MAAATAQSQVIGEYPMDFINSPMASNVTIYGGSLVCWDASGNANPGADTSGLVWAGVAGQTLTGSFINPSGGSVQCTIENPAWSGNGLLLLPAANPTQSWVGTHVFVKDSLTVAQHASVSNNVIVGTVIAVIATGASGIVLVDVRAKSALATS